MRAHVVVAQPREFTAAQQRLDDDRPGRRRRQCGRRIECGQRFDDRFIRHDDAGARRRQAQLRQAEAQHDIRIPQRIEVFVLDAGKGQAVSRIDDERHPARAGQRIEPLQFCQRQHVAGRVGGARYAQCTNVVRHVEPIEIHAVLEAAVFEFANAGGLRQQHAWREADIGIADVLGGQRQQDAGSPAVGALTGEQVEQEEECRLAAARESDIACRERPAEFVPQRLRHGLAKSEVTCRRRVTRDEAAKLRRIRRDFLQSSPVHGFDRTDARRIAAAEHANVGIAPACHGRAQVRHQLERARGPRHAFGKSCPELPHVDSPPA